MRRTAFLTCLALFAVPHAGHGQSPAPAPDGEPRFGVMAFVGYAYMPTARGTLLLSEGSGAAWPFEFRSRTRHVVPIGASVEYRLTPSWALSGAAAYARRGDGSVFVGSTSRARVTKDGRDFLELPRSGGSLWIARAGLTLTSPHFPLRMTMGPALIRELPATRSDPTGGWSDEVVEAVNRPVSHPALHLGAEAVFADLVRRGVEVRIGLDGHLTFWNDDALAGAGAAPFRVLGSEGYEGRLKSSPTPFAALRLGIAYRP